MTVFLLLGVIVGLDEFESTIREAHVAEMHSGPGVPGATSDLIGTIVRAVSSEVWPDAWVPHYAIGRTGFLDLHNGQWVPYDSEFPGPQFFDQPTFRVVNCPTGCP